MKSCPQCAHPLSANDTQQCPECGFNLALRAGDTLRDPSSNDSSDSTIRNPTVRAPSGQNETLKLDDTGQVESSGHTSEATIRYSAEESQDAKKTVREHKHLTTVREANDDADQIGSSDDTIVVKKDVNNDADTTLVDPMHTMSRPAPRSDQHPTLPLPKQDKNLKSDQPKLGELAKTLIARNEPTIVNPQAAQAAAEAFSKGLDTLIPPRTMVRKEQSTENSDYQIEEKLGSGAFGVVFRATQTPLERTVAIKVLQSKSENTAQQTRIKNDFLREAQFTGRLEHPNIVPIHDIGLTVSPKGDVNPFYVMKEIRGQSWHKEIRKQSANENLSVFKNVVNAIGFAHSQNILHCDLKPDNVMIGEFGEVLVVDWGQAVDLSNPDTMRPGGTPAYISPEMAQYWIDLYLDHKTVSAAQKDVGYRSDIYLLGAILFEIVAGFPPHCRTPNDPPYQLRPASPLRSKL